MINLFAHRGYWQENMQQNSIASLKAAHEKKFYGVEIDIWFCDGKLLVKHDRPNQGEILPKLEEFFLFKNEFEYWLDFKNLYQGNAKDAFILLKNMLENCGTRQERVYIAPYEENCEVVKEILKNFQEIFPENNNFAAVCDHQDRLQYCINFIKSLDIKYTSIAYHLVDENLVRKLSGSTIFPWTVNDLDVVKKLNKLGVKNIITDKIIP